MVDPGALEKGRTGQRVLLTGATGFVGSALYPALAGAGLDVRCATRDEAAAARRRPDQRWVRADVSDRDSTRRALEGCDAAFYLVHGMASEGPGYRQAELAQAEIFLRAAEEAGVKRVVYLGGVLPADAGSEHLRSRQEVGEMLRSGKVTTIELRASMIIGHGSLSWLIVRDLAARLPFMVLPRWLRSRTEPVAIDDVVTALVRALDVDLDHSAWFGLPGPDVLSGREILERTSTALGVRRPVMLQVPMLSPQLSSHWVRFVTRADWSVAREVVVGLRQDLLSGDLTFWERIGHEARLPFDEAAARALRQEALEDAPTGPWRVVERLYQTLLAAPR